MTTPPVTVPACAASDRKSLTSELSVAGLDLHALHTPGHSPGHVTFVAGEDMWSGDVLFDMARREGLESARLSKAFANDILLAASCRESGCVLVTDNARDFQRIRRFIPFEFTRPWPQ